MIRVVHVCASDIIGGAARASFRLHRSLVANGVVESSMLVRGKASDDERVHRYIPGRWSLGYHYHFSVKRRLMDIFWASFRTPNRVMHSRADIRTGLLAALCDLPCDLVHLHWLGTNTLSIEEISQIGKPVVWTLHDMWTFCGAEHYTSDGPQARFRTGYRKGTRTAGEAGPDLNRHVWHRKQKAWTRPMTVICPSRWMADCARESALLSNWPVHHLPNALDLERWKPFPKAAARQFLNLPEDKRIILFGAISGERDPRKGAELLRAALQSMKEFGADVHLVVFGQSKPEHPVPFAYPVTYLGRLQDEFSMILAYNAADLLAVPSRQDNLPQTAVEAQACGIPVVAFDVGGLPDIVEHQRTGYLARPFDTVEMAGNIMQLLSDEENLLRMSQRARSIALEKFAAPVVAKAHVELYRQVLAEKPRA